MNIVYATRATIPYPSAASLNSVQMCQSLVNLGHRVTLAIGRKFWRYAPTRRDWRRHYGFDPRFDVARLWELPKTGWGFDGKILQLAIRSNALLYLRYPRLLGHRFSKDVPTLLELHSGLTKRDRGQVARAFDEGRLSGVVVITAALRDHLLGFPELGPFTDRFLVAPDAVDCSRFASVTPGLNLQRIGYVGGLFRGKGMEQIAQIARLRPDISIEVFGGQTDEVQRWTARTSELNNLRLHGYVSPARIPECMDRFGIALLPNQPQVLLPNGDDIGCFTSPMKLFEYMAAGRAIIASSLPGLREVLHHESNCLLVRHNDPQDWIAAIDRLRHQPELARSIAKRAKREATERFSYDRRFRDIFSRCTIPAQACSCP